MFEFQNKKNLLFIVFSFICINLFMQNVNAQEKLPKNMLHQFYSLQEDAVMDTMDCEIRSYYGTPAYFFTLQLYSVITSFTQRFWQLPDKQLTTANIYLYDRSYNNTSGQGINLIFYDLDSLTGKPGAEVLKIQIPESDIVFYPQPTKIDVSSYDLWFEDFYYYIGFDVVNPAVDTFAFLADDGNYNFDSPSFGYFDENEDGLFKWESMTYIFGYPSKN